MSMSIDSELRLMELKVGLEDEFKKDREETAMNVKSAETIVTNSKTGGKKGSKIERYDLIPWEAMDKVAAVYGFGCTKYAPNNWRKGYDWGLSYASLIRHVNAFWSGEELDPESGLPHMAHAAWHCLTLLTFMEEHPELDDRYKDNG